MVALFAGLALLLSPLNTPLADAIGDAVARQLPAAAGVPHVLVVDIDNASLRALEPQLGRWPYSRDVYARAVETLRAAGARAIGIDLLFADAHDGDEALARAIAVPGAPVVLGAATLQGPMSAPATLALRAPPPAPNASPPGARGAASAGAGAGRRLALPAPSLWPSPQQLPRVGIFTSPLDADGRLRRMPLWHDAESQLWPSFPLALWQATAETGAAANWPRDEQGRIALTLSPHSLALPVLPFSELMRAALDDSAGASRRALADAVQGNVVVLGSSAALGDGVMTVAGPMSGTMVLAQAYAQLRDDRVPQPPGWPQHALLLGVALVPAVRTWRRGRVVPWRDTTAAALAALAVLGLSALLLAGWQWQTQSAAPLAVVLAGLALSALAHERAMAAAQRWLARERSREAAASQAKSAFLAQVSHEIRNPMSALLGVADLLSKTSLDAVQRRHVEVFRSAGASLQALLNELLDMSKIEAGRVDLQPAPFELLPLLEAQMALQRPRAQAKGLEFELILAPGLPGVVVGDAQRLGQALTNLLSNAVKFTSEGRVSLTVSRADGSPSQVQFLVTDTGVGIAKDRLEAIFDPFTQADGSITSVFGGTGLGLSITRSLVRLMGGMVSVQSTPGLGSIFDLRLPLPAGQLPAAAPAEPVTEPGALSQGGGLKLLLAEDDTVNVYLFEAMLADHGCRIYVAGTGREALDRFEAEPFDAIFMDVQMPVMDGLAATRAIRQIEAAAGRVPVPIIALTAYAFSSDVQASLAAGCNGHLTKPVTKEQLLLTLDRIAQGRMPAPGEGL